MYSSSEVERAGCAWLVGGSAEETGERERAPTIVVVPGFGSDSSVHLVGRGERWCIAGQLIPDGDALLDRFSRLSVAVDTANRLVASRTDSSLCVHAQRGLAVHLPRSRSYFCATNAALRFEKPLIDRRKNEESLCVRWRSE
ncbi:hypothetical protein ANTRET_LOCUS7575 [Anthophora retusa]